MCWWVLELVFVQDGTSVCEIGRSLSSFVGLISGGYIDVSKGVGKSLVLAAIKLAIVYDGTVA